MCDARIDGYHCARMRGHRGEHDSGYVPGRQPSRKVWGDAGWVQRAREGRLPVKDWTAA